MVDHHVDRPEVEARRRVQLTGTNRSIGLIALIVRAHARLRVATHRRDRPAYAVRGPRDKPGDCALATRAHRIKSGGKACFTVLRWSGGCSEEPEPDPIPNSAVKLLRADGTKSQDLGE